MKLAKLGLALAGALSAQAASTTTWEINGYQDFLRGRLTGVSLTRDGRLLLAPKMDMLFSSDQAEIWSVARAADGTLYLGTGHRGRVYRVDTTGRGSLLWTADQPEVFAVAVDAKGELYAATSPDGKVYRIDNGKVVEYFAPGTRYIWSLVFAKDGSLFVGTGDQGKIFHVTGPGQGEVYYETGQSHVTSLAIDSEGRLLAGTEPNGILYRISEKGKAFVLYDANLPEIRSIVPAPNGVIYAAALGGALGKRIGGAAGAAMPATAVMSLTATSVTVTDSSTQSGVEIKPKQEGTKPSAAPPAAVAPPTVELAGVERSAIYRINPDNTVETLWSSKEENVYDLTASGPDLLFATDAQGGIYRLGPDHKAALVAQTDEGETTRLVESPAGLLAATGNMGKIFRLGQGYGSTGSFESPVHDAGSVARWGRLIWRGEATGGTAVAFQTRSGNSLRPDATWSDWSEPLQNSGGAQIRSPNARYIQWRAKLTGSANASPALDNVTIAYLPQNTPPAVHSITVMAATSASQQKSSSIAAAASAASSYSITVTDTGDSSSPAGTATQTVSRAAGQQLQISWQADDPDGDRLVYTVYFRGEGETEWKRLRSRLTENTLTLDGDALADGRYYFRVVASDSPSNSPERARESDLESSPVVIDNTPPVVTPGAPRREGARLAIDIDAADQASPLLRCEYSIDAGPWVHLDASDGVTDSPRERFLLRVNNFPPGEHLVVIRAYDIAGNAGLAKVLVR